MRNTNADMNFLKTFFIGLALASFAALIALAQSPAAKSATSSKGVAVLHPTAGNKISGTVTFTPAADGVQVHAEIMGLTPGKHGFHIHEFGDCSAADASSAGAHFNPTNQPHAGPDAAARHEGDMGNVEADASGNAKLDYVDHQISLANDSKSAIGRSVVVHAKPDDLKTQPSGDAGGRIACGVIGWAKTQ
jgi:superoxide dismutase, Cu-Zn family